MGQQLWKVGSWKEQFDHQLDSLPEDSLLCGEVDLHGWVAPRVVDLASVDLLDGHPAGETADLKGSCTIKIWYVLLCSLNIFLSFSDLSQLASHHDCSQWVPVTRRGNCQGGKSEITNWGDAQCSLKGEALRTLSYWRPNFTSFLPPAISQIEATLTILIQLIKLQSCAKTWSQFARLLIVIQLQPTVTCSRSLEINTREHLDICHQNKLSS